MFHLLVLKILSLFYRHTNIDCHLGLSTMRGKIRTKTDEGGTIPFKKSIFLFKLDGYLFGQAHLLGTHSLWKGICRLAQCLHRRWKTLFPFPWKRTKRTKRKTHVTPNNATSDATIFHAVHTFGEVTCFPPFGYSEMAEIYEPARG